MSVNTYQLYVKDLAASGAWTEYTDRLVQDKISVRTGFGSLSSQAEVGKLTAKLRMDDLASATMFGQTAKQVLLLEDGQALFEGYTEDAVKVDIGHDTSYVFAEISATSYCDSFKRALVPQDTVYEGIKICDPTDQTNSLIHRLFAMLFANLPAPFDTFFNSVTPSISASITKTRGIVLLTAGEPVIDYLTAALYQNGLAWYQNLNQPIVVQPYTANRTPDVHLDIGNVLEKPTITQAPYIVDKQAVVRWPRILEYSNEIVYEEAGEVQPSGAYKEFASLAVGGTYPADSATLETEYRSERETDDIELAFAKNPAFSYVAKKDTGTPGSPVLVDATLAKTTLELGKKNFRLLLMNSVESSEVALRRILVTAPTAYYFDWGRRFTDELAAGKDEDEIDGYYLADENSVIRFIQRHRSEALAEKTSIVFRTHFKLEPNTLINLTDVAPILLVRYRTYLPQEGVDGAGLYEYSCVAYSMQSASDIRKSTYRTPAYKPKDGKDGDPGPQGPAGDDAKFVQLTGDGSVFRLDKDGNPYPGQVITLDALKQGITDELNWHIPNHSYPAGTTEVRLTPADMGYGKVTLTNIISNSSVDWETASPGTYKVKELLYSNPIEDARKHYWRAKYKYSTTDQSPVWVNIYAKSGTVVVTQNSPVNPVPDVEYILSGYRDGMPSGGNHGYGAVYNGPSNAINGVSGSTKNEMCVDLTELISLYPNKFAGMTDAQISAWCDTYIPDLKSGESWTIGGTLSNIASGSSPNWVERSGISRYLTFDYSFVGRFISGNTYYYTSKLKFVQGDVTTYSQLWVSSFYFPNEVRGLPALIHEIDVEAKCSNITVFDDSNVSTPVRMIRAGYWRFASDGTVENPVVGAYKEHMVMDMTASGWLAQLSLYGIEGGNAVGTWMDSIPYFSDSMEFPVLESLPVTVTAGEYSDGTTISIVRDGKEGLNASFTRYAYKAASSVPPTPSGDSSSVPAGWDESVPVRDAGQTIYVTSAVTTWDAGNVPSYGPWSAPSPWSGDKGDTGAPAVDFSLSAGMSTYAMSSRNAVKAAQTVTFACDRRNTSGAVTWGVNRGLTVTPSSDGATATVTIPVGFGYTSFTVTCAVEGVGTKTVQVNGVPSGTYAPMFLGKMETAPTTTAEGPLMAGDSYLREDNIVMRWDGVQWTLPQSTDDNYPYVMQAALSQVMADRSDVDSTMAALYGYINSLMAKTATLETLFAKAITLLSGGSMRSEGYDKGDINLEEVKRGFFFDSSGYSEWQRLIAREADIRGWLQASDANGIVLKTQAGVSSAPVSSDAKTRYATAILTATDGYFMMSVDGATGALTKNGIVTALFTDDDSTFYAGLSATMASRRDVAPSSETKTFTVQRSGERFCFNFQLYGGSSVSVSINGTVRYSRSITSGSASGLAYVTDALSEGDVVTITATTGQTNAIAMMISFLIIDEWLSDQNPGRLYFPHLSAQATGVEYYAVYTGQTTMLDEGYLASPRVVETTVGGATIVDTDSNLLYGGFSAIYDALPSIGEYQCDPGLSSYDGRPVVSVEKTSSGLRFRHVGGSTSAVSAPPAGNVGWYAQTATVVLATETRGIVTDNIIPAGAGKQIGTADANGRYRIYGSDVDADSVDAAVLKIGGYSVASSLGALSERVEAKAQMYTPVIFDVNGSDYNLVIPVGRICFVYIRNVSTRSERAVRLGGSSASRYYVYETKNNNEEYSTTGNQRVKSVTGGTTLSVLRYGDEESSSIRYVYQAIIYRAS